MTQITMMGISDIHPYEKNPRKNDASVDKVAASIKEFGFKVPIVIDKNNVIVTGHTRYKAAKKLKLSDVPCILADDLTDEQIKAYRLADNKVGEYSLWDFDLLAEELEDIIDIDMSNFGFLDLEFDDVIPDALEDDFNGELPEEPKAKLGDIYQLGRHRLMCGDSTNISDVEKLMGGAKADMVFTDPPYGMKKESDGVANDNLNYDDLLDFNRMWIPLTFSALKENGSWYCWGIDEPLMDIYSNILRPMQKQNQITFRNLITWDKGSGQGQLSDGFRKYPVADEKCLFVMCGVQGFNNNSDHYYDAWDSIRLYLEEEAKKVGLTNEKLKEICGVGMYGHWFTKSQWQLITKEHYEKLQKYYRNAFKKDYDAFKKDYDEIKKDYDKIKEDYYESRAYFNNTHDNMNDVWHFGKTSGDERKSAGGHATPKPIELCSRAIKSSSREGEVVLDVFGGSGSTLIASEQLNRKAYLMELEPKWVDVIIDRWESFTGQEAVLVNGNS